MAVTHADLAIDLTSHRSGRSLGTKLVTCVMFLTTVLGLLAFIFGVLAENNRTQAVWIVGEDKGMGMECMYTSDGLPPLACAFGSMLSLVMAMGIGQTYVWIALCSTAANDELRPLAAWTQSDPYHYKKLRWQAAVSFLFSWLCFAVAAVLLSVGIAVEAGHRERWSVSREKCTVVRDGVFAAAGVVGLLATSMGVAFYMIAVETEKLQDILASSRRELLEAIAYYMPASSSSVQVLSARTVEK